MSNLTAAYGQTIWRSGLKFDSLYAPPYKGTIIVSSIAIELLDYRDGDVPFRTNRKEEKDHGEEGFLIGSPIEPDECVLILDDVIRSGKTKEESVKFIEERGGRPTGLVVALDRQERGSGELSAAQEFERDFQIPVFSIATLTDIISVYQEWLDNGVEPIETAKNLESLLAYQRQYGVLTA